jgi:predicted enzyme related to lactoylglutathione lyase
MKPNTLIFVDFPSDDVEACARFYGDVFGWTVEGRPTGVFHRGVPGGFFPLDDGSDSPVGNLHVGFFDAANARPHPDSAGVEPRHLSRDGHSPRVWILVSDDDSEDAILARAEEHGAEVLWRRHYWKEFNGFNGAFRDPWGTTIVLWTKGGADPVLPEGFTGE